MAAVFDEQAKRALNDSLTLAEDLGHHYIGTEHLLYALTTPTCSVSKMLANQGVTFQKLQARLSGNTISAPTTMTIVDMSPALRCIIESAAAQSIGNVITVSHLLRAIICDKENAACRIMAEMGANCDIIYSQLLPYSTVQTDKGRQRFSSTILKYGIDLTHEAANGRLDPVLCRDKETERLIRILCRRTKNNPCLVGEAGVGKTAIVEGLAHRISQNAVPLPLIGKRIFSLDLASVVAGAKYRGEFEDRFKTIIKELTNSDTIVFIDELHTIIGAGSAEGSIDAAGILKPDLARGNLHLIGATTYDEYMRHIEKDSALARRFLPVKVEQPTPTQAIDILKGLRPKYESFHSIKITDEAISTAVELSVRYIPSRFLPDKAIDLIDEAATISSLSEGKGVLTASDLYTATSFQTGIPVETLSKSSSAKLLDLEANLSKRILGQKEAIKAIATAISRGATGLSDSARPTGSFLFCGSTGVGKTALAAALADCLFDTKDAFLRFDMSEYMEPHSVSRLIGSPPGYVGFEQTGQLVAAIKKHPYSVVLFDEIEKAHPDVLSILLQILEDGMLTDAQGSKCNFKNCIIIMTTNAGAKSSIGGFLNSTSSFDVKKFFAPELLNRIDDIIFFSPLSSEVLKQIAINQLDSIKQRRKDIEIAFADDVADLVAKNTTDSAYGARPIRRAIEKEVLTPLSNYLIKNPDAKNINAVVIDDKVVIQ